MPGDVDRRDQSRPAAALRRSAAAARQVGGSQVQNPGTLAGNVCNASPAADGVPVLLALDAEVELASPAGARALKLQDFVLGLRRTARRPDELVVAIRVPALARAIVFLKLGARRYLVISISMVALSRRSRPASCGGRASPSARAARWRRGCPSWSALARESPRPAPLVRPEHLAPLTPLDDMRAPALPPGRRGELLRRGLEASRVMIAGRASAVYPERQGDRGPAPGRGSRTCCAMISA